MPTDGLGQDLGHIIRKLMGSLQTCEVGLQIATDMLKFRKLPNLAFVARPTRWSYPY